MHSRDSRDLAGGLVLVAVGLVGAAYGVLQYDMGTVRMMGPGMVPVSVALILASLGGVIAVPAWSRSGTMPRPEWRAAVFVTLGVAAFALVAKPLGIGPAIFLLTVISARADREAGLAASVVLGAGLAFGGFAVFRYALNIPMQFITVPL